MMWQKMCIYFDFIGSPFNLKAVSLISHGLVMNRIPAPEPLMSEHCLLRYLGLNRRGHWTGFSLIVIGAYALHCFIFPFLYTLVYCFVCFLELCVSEALQLSPWTLEQKQHFCIKLKKCCSCLMVPAYVACLDCIPRCFFVFPLVSPCFLFWMSNKGEKM